MVLKWLTTHREKHIQSLPHILGKSKFQVDKRLEYERENLKILLEKKKKRMSLHNQGRENKVIYLTVKSKLWYDKELRQQSFYKSESEKKYF